MQRNAKCLSLKKINTRQPIHRLKYLKQSNQPSASPSSNKISDQQSQWFLSYIKICMRDVLVVFIPSNTMI